MPARSLVVSGHVFRGKNREGDFAWMLKQPQYDDCVFIIMENFLDMLYSDEDGGGTAALRTQTWPTRAKGARAVGVPTGWSQETNGFRQLDDAVKGVIDLAMMRLRVHLHQNKHVTRIIYSADEKNPERVGSKIFKVDDAVLQYISEQIQLMSTTVSVDDKGGHLAVWPTLEKLRTKEIKKYAQLAQAFHERDRALRALRELQEKHASALKRPREAASSSTGAGIMKYMRK